MGPANIHGHMNQNQYYTEIIFNSTGFQDQYWSQLLQYSLANGAYVGCPLELEQEGKDECSSVDDTLTERLCEYVTVKESRDLVEHESAEHQCVSSNGQNEELAAQELHDDTLNSQLSSGNASDTDSLEVTVAATL